MFPYPMFQGANQLRRSTLGFNIHVLYIIHFIWFSSTVLAQYLPNCAT